MLKMLWFFFFVESLVHVIIYLGLLLLVIYKIAVTEIVTHTLNRAKKRV